MFISHSLRNWFRQLTLAVETVLTSKQTLTDRFLGEYSPRNERHLSNVILPCKTAIQFETIPSMTSDFVQRGHFKSLWTWQIG